jgi:hypothetical protein
MKPGGATSTASTGLAGVADQPGRKQRGDRQRWHAAGPGELEGEVAREVAVGGIGRTLDLDDRSVRPLGNGG